MRLPMALLAALSGDPASAQTLELEWSADPACPGELEMQRLVHSMMIGDPDGQLRAQGLIRDRGASFELDLRWQLGPWLEHRILRSHDCDELARLAAMLLASTLDPFGAAPRDGEPELVFEPELEPEPERRPEPVVISEPKVEPEPREEPTWVLHVAEAPPDRPRPRPRRDLRVQGLRALLLVDGLGMINLLPRPGGGARLGFGIDAARFRAIARGTGWFAPGFRSTSDPEVGGNLLAWSAELATCGVPRWRHLEFPLCGQLGAGQVVGRAVGVADSRPSGQPWAWLGADASLEWWVRPSVALVGGLGLGASLVRPRFGVVGSDAEFTVPVVFGQLHAGVTARFGPRTNAKRGKTDRPDPDRQPSSP